MIEIEKQFKKSEWLKTHSLTEEQVKQLIRNKLERAETKAQSIKTREGAYECL